MKKKTLKAVIFLTLILSVCCVRASEIRTFHLPDEINLIVSNIHGGMNQPALGNGLNISWTNPDYDISSITVYEETLGDISSGEGISIAPGDCNLIQKTGLSTGVIYKFTVSITDYKGDVAEFTATGKTGTFEMNRRTEENYKSIWNYKFEGIPSASGYFLDFEDKAQGASSLRIVKNSEDGIAHFKVESDNYDYMEVGKEYEFSFWLKSELSGSQPIWLQNDQISNVYYLNVSDEWQKYTFKIYDVKQSGTKYSYNLKDLDTGTVVKYVNLSTNRFCPRLRFRGIGRAWVDDMQLHQYGEDGNLGGDMFIDGNFDWGGTFGRTVSQSDGTATVTITNPNSEKISELSVLDETGAVLATVENEGNLAKGAKNVIAINNIEQGTIYNYFVKIVINGVTQYYPIKFIGDGVADGTDYNVYPLHIEKGGQPITSLTSGNIEVSRIVDNTDGAEDLEVLFAIGLYHDDELIMISEETKTILASTYYQLSKQITVPELTDNKYELRIFLWDSADGQNIIKGSQKLN